jgi:hypothetical protein
MAEALRIPRGTSNSTNLDAEVDRLYLEMHPRGQSMALADEVVHLQNCGLVDYSALHRGQMRNVAATGRLEARGRSIDAPPRLMQVVRDLATAQTARPGSTRAPFYILSQARFDP